LGFAQNVNKQLYKSMDWFKAWFNTPYYHILYKNRNDEEARTFIENVTKFIEIPAQAKVMDLACGKGRHSVTLNQLGYDVVGLDLSDESIAYAKQFENEHLHFDVHDMREIYQENGFDAIFNLFTSFGYFDKDEENAQVFEAIKKQLKPNGILVFDYLNAEKIVKNLVPYEEKEIDGILFKITKSITAKNFIKKEIDFTADGQDWHFEEYVKVLYKKDFDEMIEKAGFKTQQVFGNYQLGSFFNDSSSDRLIYILKNV